MILVSFPGLSYSWKQLLCLRFFCKCFTKSFFHNAEHMIMVAQPSERHNEQSWWNGHGSCNAVIFQCTVRSQN